MKKRKLILNSQEEAITQIVELVSGIPRETLRSKNRVSKVSIARSILGYMLRREGSTSKRTGELVGRHHASVLKYCLDHENNLKYYDKYNAMFIEIEDEYITGFRAAKIDLMDQQIDELQIAIKKLKARSLNKLKEQVK